MASFQSIYYVLLLITLLFFDHSTALYEDQVGKFDWKRSFLGKVIDARFDQKRVIVATEDNVLASLNIKNGVIHWRQVLEDFEERQLKLYVNKDVFTISGSPNNWFVRSWDINSGTLLFEWTLPLEKTVSCEFFIHRDKLIHLVPVISSHLEISTHNLNNGEVQEKTRKIPAPWIADNLNCILSKGYYICISSNDISGQLYYVDFLASNSQLYTRPLQSLLGDALGTIKITGFEDVLPSFLLVSNNVAHLFQIDDDKLIVKPFNLMPNAVSVHTGDKSLIIQLEPSKNPEMIIQATTNNYITGQQEQTIDLDYPIGVGAPIIIATSAKASSIDLLLSTTDNALMLVRLPEGKNIWTREEALSSIVATEFFELPVSELDASIENEFKSSSSGIINMLIHRLTTQAKQLSNLIFSGQLLSKSSLVRDEFGLHKIIVVATKVGKLFAIDTLSGSVAWSYRLPNVKPFKVLNDEKMYLMVQRTARYAPLSAQVTLLAEDASSGNGIMFQFDPITGYSPKGIQKLNYKIAQAVLLPYENEDNLKSILILSSKDDVYVYPTSAQSLVYQHATKLYTYLIDSKNGVLKGFNFHHSSQDSLKLTPMWKMQVDPSKIIAVSTRHPNERVHSQGRVLPDRSVYYKYVNPNLIAIATLSEDPVHKHVLSIYLIDGVTGLILYSSSHKRARKPIHLVHSENWLVYSYFNERFRRTEIVSAELYEGHVQSNSTVFSSHAVNLLPHVQTQAYILPVTPIHTAVTLTERGITNKFLLLAINNGGVIEIPWLLLQPRFNDIPCGPEESCIPYMPELPLPAEAVINYNQTVVRIRGIEVAPARLESTSHVLVHGLDIFYTRVAPSKTFDVLKEDFDYFMIVLVLTGLIVASYITKYLGSKKALKQLWK